MITFSLSNRSNVPKIVDFTIKGRDRTQLIIMGLDDVNTISALLIDFSSRFAELPLKALFENGPVEVSKTFNTKSEETCARIWFGGISVVMTPKELEQFAQDLHLAVLNVEIG